MSLLPVFTIALLLLGAASVFVLSPVPRLRPYVRYIALAGVALATILVLVLRWSGQILAVPSLWQPSLLFRGTLVLQSDATVQPLALALTLATCSTMLVALARREETPLYLLAVLQILLSAGLLSLWAANPLTMIVAWAAYDLLQAVGYLMAGGSARTAIRALVFGGLATLFLWAGTLVSGGSEAGDLWALMSPGETQLSLWMMAALLRLGIYPFHLLIPDDFHTTSPFAVFLLTPVVGWGLALRLILMNDGLLPGSTWIPTVAAVAFAFSGFLAWSGKVSHRTVSWVGAAGAGAILLAAGLTAGNAASVIVAGGVAWTLGVSVLFLDYGMRLESPWWSIPLLVGALTLLGTPLTLGFVPGATVLEEVMRRASVNWGGAFFIGNLFLIPALVRLLLLPSSSPLPDRRPELLIYGIGLGVPTLLLVIAGAHPPLLGGGVAFPTLSILFVMPRLPGWLLWAISLAGGGVLAWQDGNVRPRIQLFLNAAHDLLRLEWLYNAVVAAMDRGLSALRAADEVVGGAGALLWSWLLFLLLVLIWGSR